MDFLNLFQYFLVLIIPGVIGALAYSITAHFRTEINMFVVLAVDLLTFISMMTGLYLWHNVKTMTDLVTEFGCLSFTRNYALLVILISAAFGVGLGFLRRLFFWLRR